MRFVGPTRAQIGVRTVFNILGPLANPAKADFMILGTYDPDLLEPMAKVLMNLGIKRAMLVTATTDLTKFLYQLLQLFAR